MRDLGTKRPDSLAFDHHVNPGPSAMHKRRRGTISQLISVASRGRDHLNTILPVILSISYSFVLPDSIRLTAYIDRERLIIQYYCDAMASEFDPAYQREILPTTNKVLGLFVFLRLGTTLATRHTPVLVSYISPPTGSIEELAATRFLHIGENFQDVTITFE